MFAFSKKLGKKCKMLKSAMCDYDKLSIVLKVVDDTFDSEY